MIQIQPFQEGDINTLRTVVNKWCREHPDIKVEAVTQSEFFAAPTSEHDSGGWITYTIMYREGE